MRVTAQMSVIIAVAFAVFCFGFAVSGFSALGDISDPQQLADAKGFAWFWTFLGLVGVVFGAVGVWLVKSAARDGDA